MDCSEFIEGFSDYLDGAAPPGWIGRAEAHVEACAECTRYRAVLERGRTLLRSFPEVEISEDFYPRFKNRVARLGEETALVRASGSAATGGTVLGIALLLTAVAWSPLLRGASADVELSPIVAQRPVARSVGLRPTPVSLRARFASPMPVRRDLWSNSSGLLYEYSPLSEKYRPRRSPMSRTGLD